MTNAKQQEILVIGGTGMVGAVVARRLIHDGFGVRVLTRQPNRYPAADGLCYITGDLADEGSLTRALDGCAGVHLSLPSGHDPAELQRVQHHGAARVARLAARCGVGHVTYTSGYLVDERFAHIPAERAKLDAEAAIRDSGVPYTIFRPTYFTDFLPRFVQGKRASVFGQQPHPIRFLALDDYAAVVSAAHAAEPANRALFVCGPQAMTFADALRLYVEQVAPGVTVGHAPFWMMKMMNRLFLKGAISEILQLMAATEEAGEFGDPTEANRRYGAPPTTVQAWVSAQHGA